MGSESLAFVSGVAFGLLLFIIVFLFILDFTEPSMMVAEKKIEYKNVYYNVTIDTAKTDSLFGKTWRK